MKLLLDTHALLWALFEPERLSDRARDAVAEPSNQVMVSAVSFFEITNKVRLGKLPHPGALLTSWEMTMARLRADVLPLGAEAAILAGTLPGPHRDPFDRLLAAQAQLHQLALVSCDPALAGFPEVPLLW